MSATAHIILYVQHQVYKLQIIAAAHSDNVDIILLLHAKVISFSHVHDFLYRAQAQLQGNILDHKFTF